MKNSFIAWLVGILIMLSGCNSENDYKKLAEEYLGYISSEEWRPTYNCKSNTFKKVVPYETFLRSMEDTSKEIYLKDFTVHGYRRLENGYFEVDFNFTIGRKRDRQPIMSMKDKQIWKTSSDADVVCKDIGMSIFFPFNSDGVTREQ